MLEQLQKTEVLLMEQSSVQGVNQQGRTSDAAWLAGIVDGEGTITLQVRTGKRQRKYQPTISIAGTYFPVVSYLRSLLSSYGVGFYVEERKGTRKTSATWQIHINGYKRVNKLLPVIQPYLRIKHKQAELLMEFLRERLNLPRIDLPGGFNQLTGKANGARPIPYTVRELAIIDEIRLRNTRDPQRLHAKHSLESEDIV